MNSSRALIVKENLCSHTTSQVPSSLNHSVTTATSVEKYLVAEVGAIDEQGKRNGDVHSSDLWK